MTTRTIRNAALILRGRRLFLLRDRPGGLWDLPGALMPADVDDIDTELDRYLTGLGMNVPAIEEDFIETVYVGEGADSTVLNLYSPTDWTGEPTAPPGVGGGWFSPDEFDVIGMENDVRNAILTVLGLATAGPGPSDKMAAAVQALADQVSGVSVAGIRPAPSADRRERGLDVLRTLSGNDPAAAHAGLQERNGVLGNDVVDFALGEVWSSPELDRRTRSLQVVAMLAALGRTGPLRSHINGALNHGATPDQLEETLRMVSVYAGFPAAIEAWEVLREVFGARGIEQRKAR